MSLHPSGMSFELDGSPAVKPRSLFYDALAEALLADDPDGGDEPERARSLLDAFDETRADHNNLKAYWLTGEGAGKWATWTELYHHLKKHMVDELAKRTAAEWFHQRYGIWPGSDKNLVAHGKKPRGNVVGPG